MRILVKNYEYDTQHKPPFYHFITEIFVFEEISSTEMKITGLTSVGKNLTSLIVPERVNYNGSLKAVTTLESGAFQESKATNVYIPDTIQVIKNNLFKDNTFVQTIRMPKNTNISIGTGTFSGCTNLQTLTDFTLSANEIPDSTFLNCAKLQEFTIPSHIVSIGQSAFQGSGIKYLLLSSSVKTVKPLAFNKCNNLEYVDIKYTGDDFDLGTGAFGYDASNHLKMPSYITVLNFDVGVKFINGTNYYENGTDYTQIITPGQEMFIFEKIDDNGCRLKYVSPKGKNYENLTIPSQAYVAGQFLNVVEIGPNAFLDDANLLSIEIPDSVTEIKDNAFKNCDKLKQFSTKANLGTCSFENCISLQSMICNNLGDKSLKTCPKLKELHCGNIGATSLQGTVLIEKIISTGTIKSNAIDTFKMLNWIEGRNFEANSVCNCELLETIKVTGNVSTGAFIDNAEILLVQGQKIIGTNTSDFSENFITDTHHRVTSIKIEGACPGTSFGTGLTSLTDVQVNYVTGMTSLNIIPSITKLTLNNITENIDVGIIDALDKLAILTISASGAPIKLLKNSLPASVMDLNLNGNGLDNDLFTNNTVIKQVFNIGLAGDNCFKNSQVEYLSFAEGSKLGNSCFEGCTWLGEKTRGYVGNIDIQNVISFGDYCFKGSTLSRTKKSWSSTEYQDYTFTIGNNTELIGKEAFVLLWGRGFGVNVGGIQTMEIREGAFGSNTIGQYWANLNCTSIGPMNHLVAGVTHHQNTRIDNCPVLNTVYTLRKDTESDNYYITGFTDYGKTITQLDVQLGNFRILPEGKTDPTEAILVNVVGVDNYALQGPNALQTVWIRGGEWFHNCEGIFQNSPDLKNVYLYNSDKIPKNGFKNCTSLVLCSREDYYQCNSWYNKQYYYSYAFYPIIEFRESCFENCTSFNYTYSFTTCRPRNGGNYKYNSWDCTIHKNAFKNTAQAQLSNATNWGNGNAHFTVKEGGFANCSKLTNIRIQDSAQLIFEADAFTGNSFDNFYITNCYGFELQANAFRNVTCNFSRIDLNLVSGTGIIRTGAFPNVSVPYIHLGCANNNGKFQLEQNFITNLTSNDQMSIGMQGFGDLNLVSNLFTYTLPTKKLEIIGERYSPHKNNERTGSLIINDNSFIKFTNLETLTIDVWCKNIDIGETAFANLTNLTTLKLKLRGWAVNIKNSAFLGCSKVNKLVLELLSLNCDIKIGQKAFGYDATHRMASGLVIDFTSNLEFNTLLQSGTNIYLDGSETVTDATELFTYYNTGTEAKITGLTNLGKFYNVFNFPSSVNIQGTDYTVTTIMQRALDDVENLIRGVNIPSSFTTIEYQNASVQESYRGSFLTNTAHQYLDILDNSKATYDSYFILYRNSTTIQNYLKSDGAFVYNESQYYGNKSTWGLVVNKSKLSSTKAIIVNQCGVHESIVDYNSIYPGIEISNQIINDYNITFFEKGYGYAIEGKKSDHTFDVFKLFNGEWPTTLYKDGKLYTLRSVRNIDVTGQTYVDETVKMPDITIESSTFTNLDKASKVAMSINNVPNGTSVFNYVIALCPNYTELLLTDATNLSLQKDNLWENYDFINKPVKQFTTGAALLLEHTVDIRGKKALKNAKMTQAMWQDFFEHNLGLEYYFSNSGWIDQYAFRTIAEEALYHAIPQTITEIPCALFRAGNGYGANCLANNPNVKVWGVLFGEKVSSEDSSSSGIQPLADGCFKGLGNATVYVPVPTDPNSTYLMSACLFNAAQPANRDKYYDSTTKLVRADTGELIQ